MATSNASELRTPRTDDYFMAEAMSEARKSSDPKSRIGACIVKDKDRIVGTGYNQMPNGANDKFPWTRRKYASDLDDKHLYVCHAEMVAIVNKTEDIKGCTIYVTQIPCNECAKIITQAGITEVVYMYDKKPHRLDTLASKKIFDTMSITYRQITDRFP